MGCQSNPDHGLIIRAIVHLLLLIKVDAEEAEKEGHALDTNEMWKIGAYICFLTAGSLRGHEGFYVELAGLSKHVRAQGLSRGSSPGSKQEHASKQRTVQQAFLCHPVPPGEVQGGDRNRSPHDNRGKVRRC
jgi:hypothetical protein